MKMTSNTKITIGFTILTLLFLWAYVDLKREKDLNENTRIEVLGGGDITKANTIDSLQKLIDSLHADCFPCQIELGRYQVAYEIFMKRNPKAASQYGTIISEETE